MSVTMLKRRFCFDDVAEATNISEEACRVFFHAMCHRWSVTRHPELASTPEEFENHTREYRQAVFDGCVGSIDWDGRTPFTLLNVCKGKEGYRAIFRVCVIVRDQGC